MSDDGRPGFESTAPAGVGEAATLQAEEPRDLREGILRARLRASLFDKPFTAPRIGRFVLHGQLGAGAMGVVYAAYDEQLDRRVAIKIIKGAADSQSRSRMPREAQALAKLSHPNVVPVFEVGEHEGQLFVAMEYVRGVTLEAWQSDGRGWREILSRYLEAGRGLAAAHAADIVHRDFKPHNAIVGEDRRVRVLDFGLSARRGFEDSTDGESVDDAKTTSALDTPLTQTGGGDGHAGLHAARAVRREARGSSQRPVLVLRFPVGGRIRHASVLGCHHHGARHPGHRGTARRAAAQRRARGTAALAGTGATGRPERALAFAARPARRPRGARRRSGASAPAPSNRRRDGGRRVGAARGRGPGQRRASPPTRASL